MNLLVLVMLAEIDFVLVKLLNMSKTGNLFSNVIREEVDSACDMYGYACGEKSDC